MPTRSTDAPHPFTGWPPAALEWFDGLAADNSKAWFHAHRATYDEAVRAPLERLLEEVSEEFGEATVSRPNRDTRFSADKTPYKDRIYARLTRPQGGGGWFVQLRPDGLFTGGGVYMPDRASLARLRSAIADDGTGPELEAIVATMEAQGATLMDHGALKTAPRGYPADQPRIGLLRLPNLAGGIDHPIGAWLHTAKAKDRIVAGWRTVTPLLDWAAEVLGPPPA